MAYLCITLSTYGKNKQTIINHKVQSTHYNFVQQNGRLITRF